MNPLCPRCNKPWYKDYSRINPGIGEWCQCIGKETKIPDGIMKLSPEEKAQALFNDCLSRRHQNPGCPATIKIRVDSLYMAKKIARETLENARFWWVSSSRLSRRVSKIVLYWELVLDYLEQMEGELI